jgi:ElaB/YqjD/DUF883 family membrane-anchored ribosome-binding protein
MEPNLNDETTATGSGSGRASTQLREQTETVREDIRKLGHLAKGAAQEKLDIAREKATEAYERGRVKVSEAEDRLVDYVRAKPLKSVLVAAGLGALIGILWARR